VQIIVRTPGLDGAREDRVAVARERAMTEVDSDVDELHGAPRVRRSAPLASGACRLIFKKATATRVGETFVLYR
jgi:hypothetical protein